MALRKQQPKSNQSERHLSGPWVSFKKGRSKNSKHKIGNQIFLKEIALSPLRGFGGHNPIGLPLAGLTTLGNPEYAYFFTGKELYEDEALQWYDYGARMYDVQIGRWTTHDPLYQDASPYVFCGNNPINMVDLDGRWSEGNGLPGYYPDLNPQFFSGNGGSWYRPNGLSAWTNLYDMNATATLSLADPKFREAAWNRAQFDLSYSRLTGMDYYERMDNLPTFSFGSLKDMYREQSRMMEFNSAIQHFAQARFDIGWRDPFDMKETRALQGTKYGKSMVKIGGECNKKYTTNVLGRLEAQTQGGGQGSSLDFMDYLSYGSSGIDLLVSGAQFTVGTIKNSGQHKAAYVTSKFLKNNLNIKIRPSDLRYGTKQFLGNASKKIAYVGGLLAVGDVLIDGNIRASHLLNMGMVGVTAIPVAGWIIGGFYFVGDITTISITGKSIGDHLDSEVGGPLVDNIYGWD